MNEHSQKTENQGRAGVVRAVLLLVVIPLLLAGVSYAWLYSGTDIQTLLKLQPPSNISILEPDQMKSLDLIRLDTSNGVKEGEDGKTITFRQPFRVRSDCQFQLEIAHTTNLKGLSFKLYESSGGGTDTAAAADSAVTQVVYNNKTYPIKKLLNGNYINPKNPEEKNGYKYADNSLHNKVYAENDKNVQAHAEPLFWVVEKLQGANATNAVDSYYILEASWTEDTSKETDIFYILANPLPESNNTQTGTGTSAGE